MRFGEGLELGSQPVCSYHGKVLACPVLSAAGDRASLSEGAKPMKMIKGKPCSLRLIGFENARTVLRDGWLVRKTRSWENP